MAPEVAAVERKGRKKFDNIFVFQCVTLLQTEVSMPL